MLHLKGHCSYFGNTGYNLYSRGFFKSLSKLYPALSIRNFTCFDINKISEEDKKLVDENTCYNTESKNCQNYNAPWLSPHIKPKKGDVNIILNETNHPYFYQNYDGIKIAYNMWETTQLPSDFFNKLMDFDQVWVPSGWQKEKLIEQGFSTENVFVIPGGVDDEFKPINYNKNKLFKFLIVGSWGFRKSTIEMIRCFIETFKNINDVELFLSVDAPYSDDGMSSTEERLKFYNINDARIKIIHFTDRMSYIKMIQQCDVLLSCSRGEGWNLPLIEALSCGKPSIFSNCGGQLEYASEYPLKVRIKKEIPACYDNEQIKFPGNYYEPDFNHFKELLVDVYNHYDKYSKLHINKSKLLRNNFSWNNSAKKAMELLIHFLFFKKQSDEFYISPTLKTSLCSDTFNVNRPIYKEIYDYNVYDNIPEMKIKRKNVVMDVGAHIGIFSRYAAEQGASRVISIEMNPIYFSCLRLNVRKEDDIFNCVLLDKSLVKFKLDDGSIINGFDLNYFFKGGLFDKLDFVKIDVSGKELILLKSIKKEVYNVIDKISIKMYNLSNNEKTNIIDEMKKNGFSNVYNILVPNLPLQFLYFWK